MITDDLINFVERIQSRKWQGDWIRVNSKEYAWYRDNITKDNPIDSGWVYVKDHYQNGELVYKYGEKYPLVSLKELYGEMMTLCQMLLPMGKLDRYTTPDSRDRHDVVFESSGRQMEKMWEELIAIYNQVKTNPKIIFTGCLHTDEKCKCGEVVYFSPIFKFDICFDCLVKSRIGIPSRNGMITCRICQVGPRIILKNEGKILFKSYCSYCDCRQALNNYNRRKFLVTDKPCTSCGINPRHITSSGSQKHFCIQCRREALKKYNDRRYKRIKQLKNQSLHKQTSDSE